MRSVEESRKRWETIISKDSTPTDLKRRLRDPACPNPCEEGLRSICWKDFLLYGTPDAASWPKKLSDSRSAYTSLRDHFLKYIEHPDDLQSTADPLSDDNNSPWSSIRQDEANRAEIFQDVERCLQDNFFFREPSTQKMLLDILFIYSKLHPDTGYRQGMHELLAPIVWVVERDAIDAKSLSSPRTGSQDDSLMYDALDPYFVEHDAFTLFCVVMQTTKSFYELGDTNPGSNASLTPIVARSHRIHEELLSSIDPELASHLQVIEILPQIFLIRWIRLLFGREFAFEDVLLIWDWLFAESLSLQLIDLICVAMLLRIRWQLMEADYSTALTLLLRYAQPSAPNGSSTLVQDALYLQGDSTPEGGANLIAKYSGRRPSIPVEKRPGTLPQAKPSTRNARNRQGLAASWSGPDSPSRSPARLPQQRGLESLFQDVSGEIQRRTETWSVAKAVKGAVGEVRRNLDSLQSGPSTPRNDVDPLEQAYAQPAQSSAQVKELADRVQALEVRNKALAKMLGDALESLRSQNEKSDDNAVKKDQAFNLSLAKLQFVQVYLEDASIPIPSDEPPPRRVKAIESTSSSVPSSSAEEAPPTLTASTAEGTGRSVASAREPSNKDTEGGGPNVGDRSAKLKTEATSKTAAPASSNSTDKPVPTSGPKSRPSLADSSFSWILGENRHRSSFITSISEPPSERRRDSDTKGRPNHLFADGKGGEKKHGSGSEEDVFTLNSLRGSKA